MTITFGTTDVVILTAFLVLSAIVGFKYRNENLNFRTYAIGDKNFSTAMLTATIVATWVSGSLFFINLEGVYNRGLYFIIAVVLGSTTGLLITGRVIGPRMGKFLNNVSVPASLGQLYGRLIQVIAGFSSILSKLGYIAVQFKVISIVLEVVFGCSGPEVTALSATIVTLYATFGGVKAVTFTDVLQFFTFGTLLPVLALTIWNNLQDSSQIVRVLHTNPLFNFQEVARWSPGLIGSIGLMCYFATPSLPPGLFQRMAMARDVDQVKSSITYATIICMAIEICTFWIAILVLVDKPSLAPHELLPYIVQQHTSFGLRGFLGIGLIALAMSSADSALNACAVIFANDVVAPLRTKTEGSLKVARWATVGMGLGALLVALHVQGLLDIILLSANVYIPVVVAPMLLAIFGFQTNRWIVFGAMLTGLAADIVSLIVFQDINSFLPGLLVNLTVLLGVHYLAGAEGGWEPLAPDSPLAQARLARNLAWSKRLQAIKHFELYPYLQKSLPKEENTYLLFGLYTLAATHASLYAMPAGVREQYASFYKFSSYSVLAITTTFITYSVWHPWLKRKQLLTYLWPAGVFYTLFCVGSMLVIISGFQQVQIMAFMLNLITAMLLLQWSLALWMAATGALLATYVLKWTLGVDALPEQWGVFKFIIFYFYSILLLFVSVLLAMRHKQATAQLETQNDYLSAEQRNLAAQLLQAFRHQKDFAQELTLEGAHALSTVARVSEEIQRQVTQIQTAHVAPQLSGIQETLQQISKKAEGVSSYLHEAIYRVSDYQQLTIAKVEIKVLVKNIHQEFTKYQFLYTPEVNYQIRTKQTLLEGDLDKIQQLLVKGICHACEHNPDQLPILVDIQDTKLDYPLNTPRGLYKKVKALCFTITTAGTLPTAKILYKGCAAPTSTPKLLPAAALLMAHNQQVVDAHYGTLEWIEGLEGTTQIYIVPARIREVRPQAMETLLAKKWHNTVVYPQESLFVEAVKNSTDIDLTLLRRAISVVKTYHATAKQNSGDPFYLYPIGVAYLLLDYTKDQDTILSALLYSTMERTRFSLHQVVILFNATVKYIVDGLAQLDSSLKDRRLQLSDYENLQQLLAMTDERVLYIKLAEYLYNLRGVDYYPSLDEQRLLATEVIKFFVPVAKHLRLYTVEKELVERSTAVLDKPL